MRIVLVLCLALAGCGKKQSPAAPANSAPAEPSSAYMKEKSTSDQPDDAKKTRTSDPCEGGE